VFVDPTSLGFPGEAGKSSRSGELGFFTPRS